ncbi:MAG: polysaccharide biosynthesis/export family protein [Planctomycetota bacterium]|jgi:polysaccharide export outer membrane protein
MRNVWIGAAAAALAGLAGCYGSQVAELPRDQQIPGETALESVLFADPADLQEVQAEALADRLRAGDLVQMTVHGHAELDTEVRVPSDGMVSLPLIGEFKLAGRTLAEAREEIRTALEREYLVSAPTSLLVREYAPRDVFVLGAVKHPRAYAAPVSGAFTLLRALSSAGGLTDDAHRENLLLLRTDTEGRRRLYRLSYTAIEKEGRIQGDVPLIPGDTLMVPSRGTVTVLGAVTKPGVYQIPTEGITLSRAVALGQGLTKFAAANGTVVTRRGLDGKDKSYQLALGEIMAGRRNDPALRAGDVVFVPESLF